VRQHIDRKKKREEYHFIVMDIFIQRFLTHIRDS
jgi:hypothetical protein